MPYTTPQSLELAAALGPLLGLTPAMLPTTNVFASSLNGLEECQAILDAQPQVETPSPLTEYEATVRFEALPPGGWWRP